MISTLFGIIMRDLIRFYQNIGLITSDLVTVGTAQNNYITDQENIFAWSRVVFFGTIAIAVIVFIIAYVKEERVKRKNAYGK